jgi:hypothetical protein
MKMGVEKLKIKERISVMRTKYSVLEEVLKFHECGWSQAEPQLVVVSPSTDSTGATVLPTLTTVWS